MNDDRPPLKIVEPAKSTEPAESAKPFARDTSPGDAAPSRLARHGFSITLSVLLGLALIGLISYKWQGGFHSNPAAPDTAHETTQAQPLSSEALDDLKVRVTNTIRRDLLEKLKATEILDVRIESTEALPDGALLLDFSASYSKAESGSKPDLRSVSSQLKLEKKEGEWRVTSISPKTSELILEEEDLIETVRKAKKSR